MPFAGESTTPEPLSLSRKTHCSTCRELSEKELEAAVEATLKNLAKLKRSESRR